MSKNKLDASKTMLEREETEEQFFTRVREEAKKKLLSNKHELNKDALRAAMSLSMLSSYFGDLTSKPDLSD